ncbi:hypothetical protein [Acinetobacter sp. GSS19]|uniref:hypothetical protein n=1 Tax=Acinetobacter sp. GSS19 TaxID=3020716 RepID=UPI00235DF52A|nr:hypothetical protein [Acinetobacter sp. GSS19]
MKKLIQTGIFTFSTAILVSSTMAAPQEPMNNNSYNHAYMHSPAANQSQQQIQQRHQQQMQQRHREIVQSQILKLDCHHSPRQISSILFA